MSITGIDMTDDKLLESPQCKEIIYGADCPHEECNKWNEFEDDAVGVVVVCGYCGHKFLVTE